jgi:phosphotransferase system HPr (HPr) family protein
MLRRVASRRVAVSHASGLNGRARLAIVNTARRFHAKVKVRNGRQVVDASDIMQVMILEAAIGTELVLTARGPDADCVLDALVELFATDFGLFSAEGS